MSRKKKQNNNVAFRVTGFFIYRQTQKSPKRTGNLILILLSTKILKVGPKKRYRGKYKNSKKKPAKKQ